MHHIDLSMAVKISSRVRVGQTGLLHCPEGLQAQQGTKKAQ